MGLKHKDYIYTNYIMAMSPNIKTILNMTNSIVKEYSWNFRRILVINSPDELPKPFESGMIEGGAGGLYFYDELWGILRNTIENVEGESKGKPAMLAQLVTTKELTKDDLLDLQKQPRKSGVYTMKELEEYDLLNSQKRPRDPELAIINRWNKKVNMFENVKTMINKTKAVGYLSLYGDETLKDDYADECEHPRNNTGISMNNYAEKIGIQAYAECPECGEDTSAELIYFNKKCPDCQFPFFRESFKKFLDSNQQ